VKSENLLVVLALISATIVSFFRGGYHTLRPIMFVSGLAVVSVICLWASFRMETRDLFILSAVTIATAFVDEYAHTSSGAFSYFDGMKPSPLTVFGWSLLVLGILTIARLIYQKAPLGSLEYRELRVLPVLISVFLLIDSAWIQGYLPFFDLALSSVYVLLVAASLIYSYAHPLGWNFWVMVTSLILSALMEYLGGVEGLWVYLNNEPMAFFIAFTWTLRTWTILAVSSLLGAEFLDSV
jgi:hypothetical protein